MFLASLAKLIMLRTDKRSRAQELESRSLPVVYFVVCVKSGRTPSFLGILLSPSEAMVVSSSPIPLFPLVNEDSEKIEIAFAVVAA